MHVNKPVIVAVVTITAVSIVRAWSMGLGTAKGVVASGTPIVTPIIMGAYIVLLVLAVIDLFGGMAAQVASALAMLALLTVILTQFPFTAITKALASAQQQQGKKAG